MRILHWYQNFLCGGAVANATLGLANAQSRLGHDVLLAAMETNRPSLYAPLAPYVECQVLTWKPRIRLTSVGFDLALPNRKFAEQLNQLRPDIVHIHGEFLPSNIWVGRAVACPTILTPQGAFHPRLFDSGSWKRRLRRNLYVRLAAALFYRRLHAIHALSPVEERQTRKILPRANVYSLPQGPSVQMETLLSNNGRKVSDEGRSDLKLIFVGRLDLHTKGLDILLQAFAQAVRRLPSDNISLTLVGPDWRGSQPVLQKLVRQLGIAEKVEFAGPKSSSDVAQLLTAADIFVLLSRREGFSLSLAEALVAGKPSVVSTEAGMVEYDELASLPYILPVRPTIGEATEAIAYCISNIGALRNSAAEFAPRARKFFEWPRIASLHIERYSQLLKGNPKAARCES